MKTIKQIVTKIKESKYNLFAANGNTKDLDNIINKYKQEL